MTNNARFPEKRRQTIKARLLDQVPAMSGSLAAEFGVSEDAIRRDLRALASEGVCERVYGGAMPISPAAGPVIERMMTGAAEKEALAARALSLLHPGQTVFLDSSSSNLLIARLVAQDSRIRIVTNSVIIAAELVAKPAIEASILGGRINAHVGGRVGANAAKDLADYNIDLCIIGACAFAADGLAGFEQDDVHFKRALIAAARSTAVLLTTEKLNTSAPYRICLPEDLDTYVLSDDAPCQVVDSLRALGRDVLVASSIIHKTKQAK